MLAFIFFILIVIGVEGYYSPRVIDAAVALINLPQNSGAKRHHRNLGIRTMQKLGLIANSKRSVNDASRTRTNGICPPTDYTRKFWTQNGGTNAAHIGNWSGVGKWWLLNKTTSDILLQANVIDTWNITFYHGHIRWNDTFRPDFLPTNPSDLFQRYLQSDSVNSWFTCTNTSQSATNVQVDYELDVFGFPVNYNALVNTDTGSYDGACTYNQETDSLIEVACQYFDSITFFPPGTTNVYYLTMRKD